MTKINQQLRDNLKDIENYIIGIIRNQPMDNDECEVYLYEALLTVCNKSKIAHTKYVEYTEEQDKGIKERIDKCQKKTKS